MKPIFLIATLCAAFSACAAPVRDLPHPEFQPSTAEARISNEWWQGFGSHELNTTIEEALKENFSLRMAWDRLAQAEAEASLAGVDLTPSLEARAGGSATRERANGSAQGDQSFNLGLFASYEIDLWGRLRANAEAASLELEASQNDVRAAAVSLAAELTLRWLEAQAANKEIEVLEAQLQANQDILEVIETQFANGAASAPDVLRQENLVEATQGSLALLQRDRDQRLIQVALLKGDSTRLESARTLQKAELPALSTLGSNLSVSSIRMRPDVHAAYLRVQAQDQATAAAIADRFPRLSISASAETRGKVGDLFDNWVVGLAGSLVQPLIDGGARESTIDLERARLSELVNGFSLTVQMAVQEVESAAIEEKRLLEYHQRLVNQEERAATILEQIRERYLNQQAAYIDVLNALTTLHSLQRTLIRNHRDVLAARVAIYRASAGAPKLIRPESRHDELKGSSETGVGNE